MADLPAGTDVTFESDLAQLELQVGVIKGHYVGVLLAQGAVATGRGLFSALTLPQVQPVALHVRLVREAIPHSVDVRAVRAGFLRGLGAFLFGPPAHAIVCGPRGADAAGAHFEFPCHHLNCCGSSVHDTQRLACVPAKKLWLHVIVCRHKCLKQCGGCKLGNGDV